MRDIDAVAAANDVMAIGAMDVLRLEMGATVPDDIQIVGHDDTEAGRFLTYQLTSVRQNMFEMFSRAIELTTSRRNDMQRADADVVIENQLITRRTTLG